MSLTNEQRDRVLEVFRSFLAKRVAKLEGLTLDQMTFNVLALRLSAAMLELNDVESLIRYRLAQRLERSLVTAFGTALQTVAKEIGGSGTGVEGADIMVVRDGRRHYIQVKSGPETFNKDIAQNISAQLNAARARDPGSICLAGVCYGQPGQIAVMVHDALKDRGVGLLVGAEFWEFLSGDQDCMTSLLDLARRAAQEAPRGTKSFTCQVECKLAELTTEFRQLYGDSLCDATWRRFLGANS